MVCTMPLTCDFATGGEGCPSRRGRIAQDPASRGGVCRCGEEGVATVVKCQGVRRRRGNYPKSVPVPHEGASMLASPSLRVLAKEFNAVM